MNEMINRILSQGWRDIWIIPSPKNNDWHWVFIGGRNGWQWGVIHKDGSFEEFIF